MFLFHHLMQGSVLLPNRVSQQSLAVLQSARSFTPELVGACHIRPSPTRLSCKLEGNLDCQDYPGRSIGADSLSGFCPRPRLAPQGLSSAKDKGIRRMPGNSFVRFSHCSHSSSLAPFVFHRSVAIHGQSLDYSPWKSLVSGLPGPVRHNPAQPWYCIPSRALRGLKTTHYGSVAGKRAEQDLLIRERDNFCEKKNVYGTGSEKGWISALSSSEGGRGDVKEKFAEEPFTVFDEDTDSESEEEETNEKHKKINKLKCEEEEEDSESDSDDEEEMHKLKKCPSKSKGEVRGMSEDDSESASDDEKEMRKKMKADKKELKKQAKKEKKQLKALKTIECEDSESEDDDDKEKKKKNEKKNEKVVAVSEDEHQISQYQYLDELDSGSDGENDGQEDDVVEVVPHALGEDEGGEEDFELIEDEEVNDEIESEIEAVFEDYEDEDLDDDFWEEEEGEARVGDGGDGGGVVLGESLWENKALELAEIVVKELGTEFAIYAFKASADDVIRVRIDKLSDQYGSPSMTEIETFSRKYSEILDSSEVIPDSVAVEVSSPGAERIVKIPDELERFKLLPMYVQYFEDESGNEEKDGVLELESLDSGSGMTIWKLANVKFNREQSGKGRPLNSKQRKWRAHVPLNSLKLVRLYLDV